ncbi:MAG: methylenetetrahydrofolate reductase [Miltoncostaeaceae bacterium]|jgi:methylenetetrahydrofolate reductase (NADPH)|nr:methylenetetrahydrofolate reductase [Miltoncostaeaceae bacterium]
MVLLVARIPDLLATGPTWSLEFFPPRTDEAEERFRRTRVELAPLGPTFASVTYGALGSTQEKTRELVVEMNADHPFPTMAHLTCVGHTRAQIRSLLDQYAAGGVENILALGGDPPADGSDPGGDFSHAIELVEMVREHPAPFSVGVAAHPELHPRSTDRRSDRRNLAAKLELADFAITQFFFRMEDYARMLDELGALGCTRPVVPGVMPIVSAEGLRRMSAMNRTAIPPELAARLDRVGEDAAAVTALGVEVAVALCEDLTAAGAPGLHLYTLNRSESVLRMADALGLRQGAALPSD